MAFLKDGMPCRYILALMAFLGMVFNYMLRISINVTIVAMVNHSANANEENDTTSLACSLGSNVTETKEEDGPFPWNDNTQAAITSSFFWGYIVTQIPGGRLAEIIGGKWIWAVAIMGTGILNIIFPFCAADSPTALIALRVVMGLFEGPTYPVMHAILAKWAPPEERSLIAGIVYAGSQAGTIIAYPVSSLIADELGWEYVFYIIGGASILWGVAWIFLMYDSPAVHPRISAAEREYLEKVIGKPKEGKAPPVPWKAILTSMPFWAILIADIGNNWGFWMLLTEIPIYMKKILNYDLKSNGLLSALPYLGMWLFSIAYGGIADVFVKRKILSIKSVRKIATLNSHLVGAFLLVGVAYTGCDQVMTIVLLTAAVTFQGAIYTGFLTNHIDIAPNFAGTTYGITNCIASIPSFVAPMSAAALTNENHTLENWRKVFFIAAAFYAGGSIFFLFFADGEVQEWNEPREESSDPEGKRRRSSSGASKDGVGVASSRSEPVSDKTEVKE